MRTTSYEIHDNGGRPFCVERAGEHIRVYEQEYVKEEDYYMLGRKILSLDAEKVWIGDNDSRVDQALVPHYSPKGMFPGNSILLRRSDGSYLYIGSEIYSFETPQGDAIQMYYSPVGNSDVPYPYAVGETHVYFMVEKKKVAIAHLDMDRDLYAQLYRDESLPKQDMQVALLHPSR